jgi:hypothetical protein
VAITKVELIELLRGLADHDEVECISVEKTNGRREERGCFRNVPIYGVYNKTKKWELLLDKTTC